MFETLYIKMMKLMIIIVFLQNSILFNKIYIQYVLLFIKLTIETFKTSFAIVLDEVFEIGSPLNSNLKTNKKSPYKTEKRRKSSEEIKSAELSEFCLSIMFSRFSTV